MRLNKKKLAALAMSAVMAASTMPFPVFAEEFTDGTETTVVEEAEVVAYAATTPEFSWNGEKFIASYTDADGNPQTKEATAELVSPADCENDELYKLTVKINNVTYTYKNAVGDNEFPKAGTKLGHAWSETEEDANITESTCTSTGHKDIIVRCTRSGCTATKTISSNVTIPKKDHTPTGTVSVSYTDLVNVDIVDNKPVVRYPDEDASYTIVTSQNCSVCGTPVITREPVSIPAKQTMHYEVDVDASTNIADTNTFAPSYTYLQDIKDILADIELEDCTEAGVLVVKGYRGTSSVASYTEKLTVPKHHMVVEGIAVSTTDADLLTVTTDDDGNLVVTNTSCSKDVKYNVVKYCTAAGCKSTLKVDTTKTVKLASGSVDSDWHVVEISDTKTATHEGNHAVNTWIRNNLLDWIDTHDDENGLVNYEALKTRVAGVDSTYKKYIKLSDDTATCTEAGTATITFYCNNCNTLVENKTITVKTAPLGHQYEWTTVPSSVVEPTCKEVGHREIASLCVNCGKEEPGTEKTTIYDRRKAHSNEIEVDSAGLGTPDQTTDKTAYINFIGDKVIDVNAWYVNQFAANHKTYDANRTERGIYTQVCTNCKYCGDHEVVLNNTIQGSVSIEIVDIEKENASGVAGHITLKATYTNSDNKVVSAETTVPYYSSELAYQGRVEPEVINGLHTDKDGLTRYYEDGKLVETTGIIKYAGREYLVKDGVLCDSTHGVTLVGDTFYFLANGCVQRGYTGVAIYDNESFYLSNGVVDTNVNGLVPYNGGTFLFAAGQLKKDYNGLWQNFDGSWYFLALGQVQTQYTGVAEYDGAYFYVKNGKLDTTKNGTITVDGVKYTAVDGQLYK